MANVSFIVLHDIGFGNLGCHGSPIATSTLDGVAAEGLGYRNMTTTALLPAHLARLPKTVDEEKRDAARSGMLSGMLVEQGSTTYMGRHVAPDPG